MEISKNILNNLSAEGFVKGNKYYYFRDNHGKVFRCKKILYNTGLEKWVYCGELFRTSHGLVLI